MEKTIAIKGSIMTTGAFIQNVGKLFSELKLVTDNLFIGL